MIEFSITILAVFILILFIRTAKLKRANIQLTERIQKLENIPLIPGESPVPTKAPIANASAIAHPPANAPAIGSVAAVAPSVKKVATPIPIVEQKKLPKSETWKKLEKQFTENWTGILGTIILVIGAGFLSIYAALTVSAFFRFLMTILFAGALYGLHYYQYSKTDWRQFSVWIRSAAGAIFLFACLGAGEIAGLQWIENPVFARILLCVGILVNLYFSYAGKIQTTAALHVTICLIALAIVPQSQTTLILATLTAACGIGLAYRIKWEYHLLIVISAFLVYHLFWYFSFGFDSAADLPVELRISGIFATLLIGLGTACVHYRAIYRSQTFDVLPFLSHLTNWIYMAIGFLLYSTGSQWNTLILAIAAVAAFLLSRRAKALGIPWLHATDTLIAQSIALLGLYTLERWQVDSLFIVGAMYLEILVFLYMMIRESEKFLKTIGVWLHHISALVVMGLVFALVYDDRAGELVRSSAILAAVFVLEILFHFYLFYGKNEDEVADSIPFARSTRTYHFSIGGIIAGMEGLLLFGLLMEYAWSGYALVFVSIPLLFLRQRLQSNGLGLGLLTLVAGAFALSWFQIRQAAEPPVQAALYCLPFFAIPLLSAKTAFIEITNRRLLWPGIYLFAAHLIVCSYLILTPLSPFLPGVLWLTLSVVCLELALYCFDRFEPEFAAQGNPQRHLLNVGYMLVGLFLLRHVLTHLQSELYIGFIKVRFLIEILAVAVLLYWATARKKIPSPTTQLRAVLQPLFWELTVGFSIMVVLLETPSNWLPPVWALFALLLLFLGDYFDETLSLARLRLYSLFLHWTASFQVAFISSSHVTPSVHWLDQAWTAGAFGLLLQFAYIVYFHKRSAINGIVSPETIAKSTKLLAVAVRNPNLWIYYPAIIAMTLFLYWSFDSSILTLLWVGEAFAIFVLSIVLRENHFRYFAMAGLVGCLLRLLLYDLSQSGALTRAIVFLGVGVLMLLMNSLYNKYKDRF